MSVATCCTPACEDVFRDRTRTATPGRMRVENQPNGDRTLAVWIHLASLLGVVIFWPLAVIVPLVMWLSKKDDSPFVDDHGREVLNFIISFVILHVILAITIVGIVLLPVLWIVGLVNVIRGAVAAGRDEFFRYPMTFRFLG
ncbi:MAG: DUF4870 domain-containing protein [Planctomycetota bacterium]|jgi:uncharacterized Tic20 family protein